MRWAVVALAAAGGSAAGGPRLYADTPAFLPGGTLHGYQLEGLNWLANKREADESVILADEVRAVSSGAERRAYLLTARAVAQRAGGMAPTDLVSSGARGAGSA